MKVVIIEEEEILAQNLKKTMDRMQEVFKRVDTFPDFSEFAQHFKKSEQPDLLLLDVLKLDHKALRFIQSHNVTSPLLFTNVLKTNNLIKGPHAEGFIKNLITANNFLQAKSKKGRMLNDLPESKISFPSDTSGDIPASVNQKYHQRFLIKNKEKLISIRTNNVSLFYSEGRFNFVKTKDNRKFIINYTMETLNSLLDPGIFFRINRSMIISFDDIKDMFAYFGGRIKIVLNTPMEGETIVSRDKVNDFKKWLGE